MKKNYRAGRLGEEIKKIISDLLLREIKDPRLDGKLVSITAVKVSSDGSHATIYFTYLSIGGDANKTEEEAVALEQAEVLKALNSCKSFIRKEIGKNVKLRHIPDLVFKYDTSTEYGMHIEEIISTISKSEEQL